jgi:uncharacterized coiled-coil protein SlyX
VFGVFVVGLTALAEVPSQYTPWIVGVLVPLASAILMVLWKIQGRLSSVEAQLSPMSKILEEVAEALRCDPRNQSRAVDRLPEKLEHVARKVKDASEGTIKSEEEYE